MHGWVCEQLFETKHLTILPQVLEHADCVVLIERSDEGKAERENLVTLDDTRFLRLLGFKMIIATIRNTTQEDKMFGETQRKLFDVVMERPILDKTIKNLQRKCMERMLEVIINFA